MPLFFRRDLPFIGAGVDAVADADACACPRPMFANNCRFAAAEWARDWLELRCVWVAVPVVGVVVEGGAVASASCDDRLAMRMERP